jgi:hypothetical protein
MSCDYVDTAAALERYSVEGSVTGQAIRASYVYPRVP